MAYTLGDQEIRTLWLAWSSCDALRGGMDASQYKDYVLVMLFVKYVSDKYAGLPRRFLWCRCKLDIPKNGTSSLGIKL